MRSPSFWTTGDLIECGECYRRIAWTKDPEDVIKRLMAEHECDEDEDW